MSDPKPGDRVTPENVADLPIGTVVRWTWDGTTFQAEKVAFDVWAATPRDAPCSYDDFGIVDGPETTIVTIGTDPTVTAIAHLTHAAQTDGAHHKQHDVCAALRVLLSTEDYAALGIVDEGVPS